jgi:hypothetical protein
VKALEKAAEAVCPQGRISVIGPVDHIEVYREGMACAAVLAFLDAVIEEDEREAGDEWTPDASVAIARLRALRDEVADGD